MKALRFVGLVIGAGLFLVGFYALSQHNYLLYHSGIELFAVGTAAAIFTIGWNSRTFARSNLLLVLAVGYLAVGLLDLLHALSYGGMGVFPQAGGDLGVQLWIAARYLESGTLLVGAFVLGRTWSVRPIPLLVAYGSVTGGLIASILVFRRFPVCYVAGEGLTPFKLGSEYLISAVLLAAGVLFWQKRSHLSHRIFLLTIGSVAATILSELSFTLYVDLYGFWNFAGHILKLVSFILIYLALVQGSLLTPYDSLFRGLRRSQESLQGELAQRRRAEERLRRVMAELERSNTELEQFAYVASHDLQEPLRKVVAFGDRLETACQDLLTDSGRDYLARMQSAAQRMSQLISDLLALSRVTTKGQPFVPVDLQAIVREVLTDLEVRTQELGATIEVGDLPTVEADPTQMRQLFQNLIGNALKFHRKDVAPNVVVDAETVASADGAAGCRIAVADNGIGFDEKHVERMFQVFQRLHSRTEYSGTGIGLAICRRIAERHGGAITARSVPGEGSRFIVTLPVEHGAAGEP